MKWELRLATPEEVEEWGNQDYTPLPPDDSECDHDWRPVWSTNAAGRAYRCEKCWDRTD
jgi:hypothetical protein